MRVVHVISAIDPVSGGTAAAMLGMARSQKLAGLDVSVLATWNASPGMESVRELESAGIAVRSVQTKGPLSRHHELPRIAGELVAQSDIVHIHAMWEEVQHQGARAAQKHGIPYVMTPHGMLDPWNMTKSPLKKRLYLAWRMRRNLDRAATIHFATDIERDWVARFGFLAPPLVEPFGVDLEEFAELPPPGAFRQKHSQIADRPMIAFLGRLHVGKGLELLIPAFADLEIEDTVLVVIGPESNYGAQARQQAQQLGVADRVVFTGMLTGRDKVAALADADLFCLPSFHENFGVAVVEALAAGTPVVVSDQVNLYREIKSAGVGSVSTTSVGSVADELERLLLNDTARAAASSKARPFAQAHFDSRIIAGHWVDHYQRIVSHKARSIA